MGKKAPSNQPDIALLIDQRELTRLMESFAVASGMDAALLDRSGSSRLFGPANPCALCRLIQSTPEGMERCIDCMKSAGELAATLGDTYITRCHAGLVELFAPVMKDSTYLGSIICGPVLMWDLDEFAMKELLEQVGDLSLPKEELLSAACALGVQDAQRIRAAADLLHMAVSGLAEMDTFALEHRRSLNDQQSLIAQSILERKADHITALEYGISRYPLHKEKELLGLVRLGERYAARGLLNDILGELFLNNCDLDVLKARMLELVAVLSRAAVEGGGRLNNMLGLDYDLIRSLYGLNSFEDICLWISRALDTIMDSIYETRNMKNADTLNAVMRYIQKNYAQSLSLEGVARQVYISPFYLSRLFSNQLGITFVEYLTRVRMERAKVLLADKSLSIQAVANRVGYDDSGYFGRVFKKQYELTPHAYRRNI